MGRSPISSDDSLKKGPWSPEEDKKLTDFINQNGHGSWQALPGKAGLNRCGKSCRLRWTNYLRPNIKRGRFSDEEEDAIITLHSIHGNKWSTIASHLPGRTDNEIKNFWNTHLRKRLIKSGIDPKTHKPLYDFDTLSNLSHLLSISNFTNFMNPLEVALSLQADHVAQMANVQLLQNLLQVMNNYPSTFPNNAQENFMLGSHYNFPQLDGLVNNNGTSGIYSQGFPGMSTFSGSGEILKLLDDNSTDVNSPGFSQGVFSLENPINKVEQNFGTEYSLPEMISESPGTCNINEMENIKKDSYIPLESSIFDDWENAVENEDNTSFWKDITP